MNPEQKFLARYSDLTKSIVELIDVLAEIDLDDPANDANEWSMTDNNGERITLSFSSDKHEMTITKGRLKLSLDLRDLGKEITKRAQAAFTVFAGVNG